MTIYCTGCEMDVDAYIATGREMYPHRRELGYLKFWVCPTVGCGAFVGTHHKSNDPMRPLGFLATKEVKRWRMLIHQALDPLWMDMGFSRKKLYKRISKALGHQYHTAEIYSAEEGEFVYNLVQDIRKELAPGPWNR